MILTGVGSRESPMPIIEQMIKIGRFMSEQGWTLRSGGADGADAAFELGWDGPKEIYLPWKKFNRHPSPLFYTSPDAYKMAETYHPKWPLLSWGAKSLHARNCHQVLGPGLDDPSDLLICWTKEGVEAGKDAGGTRTAIAIARDWNVPVVNLALVIPDNFDWFVNKNSPIYQSSFYRTPYVLK